MQARVHSCPTIHNELQLQVALLQSMQLEMKF